MPKSKKRHVTPAELLEHRFGGGREASRILGRDETWLGKVKSRGGHIPVMGRGGENLHQKILDIAKERGVRFTAAELVNGGLI